ncbi:MAG: helix-turn-helix domain-containing protein [Planctomycetaceae bacterium]
MRLEQKLLTEMVRRGLNGQKLAKISQVSDSEISRILAGKSRPGLENAFRLAKAVGVSLDYLADDALDSDPARSSDPFTMDEREVLDLAHGIGCARAVRILDIVRYLGCDIAMHRLLDAKPIVEVDDEARAATPAPRASPA